MTSFQVILSKETHFLSSSPANIYLFSISLYHTFYLCITRFAASKRVFCENVLLYKRLCFSNLQQQPAKTYLSRFVIITRFLFSYHLLLLLFPLCNPSNQKKTEKNKKRFPFDKEMVTRSLYACLLFFNRRPFYL